MKAESKKSFGRKIGHNRRWLFQYWKSHEKKAIDEADNQCNQLALLPPNQQRQVEQVVNFLSAQSHVESEERSEIGLNCSSETVDPLAGFHSLLIAWLYRIESPAFENFWCLTEEKVGLKRETISYGILSTFMAILFVINLSELICSLVGVVYPIMCTYELLKLPACDVPDELRRHWMCYWAIFGMITGIDFIVRSMLPFYHITKAMVLLAVAIPDFRLAQTFYDYSVKQVARVVINLVKKYAL
ncbi:unnamed protein product [Bursaphelenchus okinawaensis]|uniref:Receptor expression-enhancing protein n=1 Tax=Bursaphelenchus okinawaensis TaxID=465554 RepID=A0A811LE19_9BILA|nr:unnamed protein product [Bursaphelenchus okinawaensis]CAG9121499.1 unnamed protein product [Bursaphelenchus okinawaensis]